jgi:hypothetical protein
MATMERVFWGTTIPTKLRDRMTRFCRSRGMKLTYFVAETLKTKLDQLAEDAADAAVVEERRKNAEYVPMTSFDAYLAKAKSGKI